MKISDTEFEFVHEDVSEADIELFSMSKDATRFDDSFKMEDVAVAVGIFPSKGQARKNGFGGELKEGFTDMVKTKKRINITILNKGDWMDV